GHLLHQAPEVDLGIGDVAGLVRLAPARTGGRVLEDVRVLAPPAEIARYPGPPSPGMLARHLRNPQGDLATFAKV
ncbi:MAG: hypothetical protein LC114_16360, partial [Bryobacterales bacterium]|nr:hypothetical protein [Bryobacterales bacterium]